VRITLRERSWSSRNVKPVPSRRRIDMGETVGYTKKRGDTRTLTLNGDKPTERPRKEVLRIYDQVWNLYRRTLTPSS